MGFGRKQNAMGLAALAGETAKMAKNMMVLDKTEAALEKELQRDEQRVVPTSKIGKVRRKGEHMLHAKYILLLIVILNVTDCLLVLGELMLDIKYVTDLLTKEYDRSDEFLGSMKGLYPARLGYLKSEDIVLLEHELLIAHITWDNHGDDYSNQGNNSALGENNNDHYTGETTTSHHVRKRRGSDSGVISTNHGNGTDTHDGVVHEKHHGHSVEEDVAHALHKASITILGILVVETLIKIFCYGKEMLEHKLECFDSFIVVASFVVDLVFLKGLQQFTVQEFVLILAFMVPWRIIRVVNSLVVAIMDHEHFRLKILYKQKKKITHELKEATDENKGLEACINALEKMCHEAGLSDTLVKSKLNIFRKVKAKTNAMGALSSFAIGGDAMKKPFTNGKTHNTDVIIDVENNATKTAKKLDTVLTGAPSVVGLANKTLNITASSVKPMEAKDLHDALITDRPRSHSAIEYTDRRMAERDSILLRRLAENSAGFIATINRDDISQKMTPVMENETVKHQTGKTTPEKETAIEITEGTLSYVSDDSFDSKTRPDTDGLMKHPSDDNDEDDPGIQL